MLTNRKKLPATLILQFKLLLTFIHVLTSLYNDWSFLLFDLSLQLSVVIVDNQGYY